MRQLWREFKTFAMSGNVLDLALGFLIGAAFASLVESLATNVLMQMVAAIAGRPDFSELIFTLNGARIKYGAFLTDLVNFFILAFVMFAVVKLITRIGIAKTRSLSSDGQCPYCRETVPESALACKACGRTLVEEMPSLEEARQRLAAAERTGLRLKVPLPVRRRSVEPE